MKEGGEAGKYKKSFQIHIYPTHLFEKRAAMSRGTDSRDKCFLFSVLKYIDIHLP